MSKNEIMDEAKAAGIAIGKQVRSQWGNGWKHITPMMRQNAIARAVIADVMSAPGPVDPAIVRVVYDSACVAAGTEGV